jgi:elongation factor P
VRLVEFLHVKPGKGSAFVRTKIKNLVNGSVQERTFRAGESITGAEVVKTEMQYTYSTEENLCFMNMETFEEQVIDRKKIDNIDFLVEGTWCPSL